MDIRTDYQLMPKLSEQEYETLKKSITEYGVLLPILLDEAGHVLDGHHRLRVCQDLKITNYPVKIVVGLEQEAKISMVITANAIRRHLTMEQRRDLVCKLSADHHFSCRKIGELLGLSHETIRLVLNSGVKNLTPEPDGERVVGLDGKSYPKRAKPTQIVTQNSHQVESALVNLQKIDHNTLPATTMDSRRFNRVVRDIQTAQRRETAKNMSAPFQPNQDILLRVGDFKSALRDIDADSASLILTDPPYGHETLSIWADLGEFSMRVLKPGGILAIYSGQYHLPEVVLGLSRHLQYIWTIALVGHGPSCAVHARSVNSRWKPVLIFCKPPQRLPGWFSDLLVGNGPEKDFHPWQQGVAEAAHLMMTFSQRGDLVIDPCCGSGTNALAAIKLQRQFIGCDVDPVAFRVAMERIQQTTAIAINAPEEQK